MGHSLAIGRPADMPWCDSQQAPSADSLSKSVACPTRRGGSAGFTITLLMLMNKIS